MSTSNNIFQHMKVSELSDVLGNKTHVVVDIRDAGAFSQGHILDAIHLTNDSLSEFIRTADIDAPVVVCCYHGNSSQQAAQFLINQDFTQVYSLDGGFSQWLLQYPDKISR